MNYLGCYLSLLKKQFPALAKLKKIFIYLAVLGLSCSIRIFDLCCGLGIFHCDL